jgi:hypothetical protein
MNTVRIEISGIDEVVALQTGQLATIPRPLGVRLTCVSGILWVTQGGSARDLVLYPDDALLFDRRAAVYLYSLQACAMRLEAPMPTPSLWERVARPWSARLTRAAPVRLSTAG